MLQQEILEALFLGPNLQFTFFPEADIWNVRARHRASGHVRPSQRLGGVAACLVVARRGSCAKAVCCVSRALAVELSAAALFSTDGTSEAPSVAPGSSTAVGGASGQGDSVAALHAILVALRACAGSCMPHLSLAVGTLVAAHAVGHISRTKRRRGRHAADTPKIETG